MRPPPSTPPPPKRAKAQSVETDDEPVAAAGRRQPSQSRSHSSSPSSSASHPPPSPTFAQTIAAWKWKREHLTDRARFHTPYVHRLDDGRVLTLRQAPFGPEGFASTTWDSSIVLAKSVEKKNFAGRACLDLSAGVGLVAAVLSTLSPPPSRIVATDLPPNLPLLKDNLEAAAGVAGAGAALINVQALTWGDETAAASCGTFDAVFAADVAYIPDAVVDLATTLAAVTAREGAAWIAHGRNRGGWHALRRELRARGMVARRVPTDDLHEKYRTVDVDVWRVEWRRREE